MGKMKCEINYSMDSEMVQGANVEFWESSFILRPTDWKEGAHSLKLFSDLHSCHVHKINQYKCIKIFKIKG